MEERIVDVFTVPIRDLEPAVPLCVEAGTTLDEVVEIMQAKRIGCMLVTRAESLIGLITERDMLLHVLGKNVDLAGAAVEDYMTSDPESLGVDDSIAFAMNRMNLGGYRHVPLVDEANSPVGIVSVQDIVNYLVEHFPAAVLNLPPEPGVFPESREGA